MAVVRGLFESRMFDASRVFGEYQRVVIDGSVQEKCRKGFDEDGKASGAGRYRYVLQASVLLFGHPIPLMQEHIDVVDPQAEMEDCEIGMEHVFCAKPGGSKNDYSLMQIAYMLWTLFYHGLLKRICAWARTWSQIAIAKRLKEGLRMLGGAVPGFEVGQLRFVT